MAISGVHKGQNRAPYPLEPELCGYWELNPGTLQNQQVLLNIELSLQSRCGLKSYMVLCYLRSILCMLNTLSICICLYFTGMYHQTQFNEFTCFPLFVDLSVLPECACAPRASSTHRDQKRAPDTLKL